jgi:glycosyltransferase involved in cell wall biosynthesis
MKSEIINRSNTKKKILIIENPSVELDKDLTKIKKNGISFTGNLGRLQRIPMLIKSIKKYFQKGGKLEFVFAGGGVYADQILKLSNDYPLIKYYGTVSSENAALISSSYEWALCPIEDQITHYAFPSKLATYACTGAKILAICSDDTSVANWIKKNRVGFVVKPTEESLIDIFFKIEKNCIDSTSINLDRSDLKKILSMHKFVNNLKDITLS